MSIGAIVGITIGAVVLGLIIAFVIWLIVVYNGMVKMRNGVDESFVALDDYLKKRYEIVSDLVSMVKGILPCEKVTTSRSAAMASIDVAKQLENERVFESALNKLLSSAETNSGLGENASFLDLRNSLNAVEEEIDSARKYYNALVKLYNIKREVFPSNMLAKMFHFESRPQF